MLRNNFMNYVTFCLAIFFSFFSCLNSKYERLLTVIISETDVQLTASDSASCSAQRVDLKQTWLLAEE